MDAAILRACGKTDHLRPIMGVDEAADRGGEFAGAYPIPLLKTCSSIR